VLSSYLPTQCRIMQLPLYTRSIPLREEGCVRASIAPCLTHGGCMPARNGWMMQRCAARGAWRWWGWRRAPTARWTYYR
jgi:hypothetical protein